MAFLKISIFKDYVKPNRKLVDNQEKYSHPKPFSITRDKT